MWTRYDLLLEDLGPAAFIDASDLENLRCVQAVVRLALHGRYIPDRHFNDSDIRVTSLRTVSLSDKEGRVPCICR